MGFLEEQQQRLRQEPWNPKNIGFWTAMVDYEAGELPGPTTPAEEVDASVMAFYEELDETGLQERDLTPELVAHPLFLVGAMRLVMHSRNYDIATIAVHAADQEEA
jgi:hypothetical protein